MSIDTYLDLEAALDGRYLHPGGRVATRRLLERMRGDAVLEIGCGTGATLAELEQRFGRCVGLDHSARMLGRAAARAGAMLVRAEAERLPFPDARFDVVVAESVAALVDFETALPEWVRVLKPGGMLALNDGLWREGVDPQQVAELTRWCLDSFGVRMALDRPHTISTWTQLLEDAGLRVDSMRLDPVPQRPVSEVWRRRWNRLVRPWLWPAILRYRRHLGRVDGSLIEFWIITATKI